MRDPYAVVRPWVTFCGFVLGVAVLYWARTVIVPVALATLITFQLSPVVSYLQRWFGRVLAVLVVALAAFSVVGLAGWAVTHELSSVVQDLPRYRVNIRDKIRDIRWASHGGSVETLQKTVDDIKSELAPPDEKGAPAKQVYVEAEPVAPGWGFPTVVGPMLERLATAGLVVVLVIFMLLERQELRSRIIRLFGHGRLAVTTRAFDEAGQRVSHYLLVQSMVNAIYGLGVGVGCALLGVPYPILWGGLAGVLRFIPYVGPLIAGVSPVLVSLAVLEGWTRPLIVAGLFVALELFTNLVLETFFYADAAGVSQVGLLVAVSFWTWMWGPVGLLLATPLTVCLVVLGKYVPGLEVVSTLMSDQPVFDPDVGYYQRVLAGDQAEAADLVEQYVKTAEPDTLFDAIILPALTYAERDRIEDRLTVEDELGVIKATEELLAETDLLAEREPARAGRTPAGGQKIPVLGCPAVGEADALALRMLGSLLDPTSFALDILPGPLLVPEVLEHVRAHGYRVVCVADLPPSAPVRSRYLVKRLRAALPEVKLLVGRWAPPVFADDSLTTLLQSGADEVATTLIETRDQLERMRPLLETGAPQSAGVAG